VKILRLMIPKGQDRPYCVDDYKYYVRDEAETTLAVRDELVALVRESLQIQQPTIAETTARTTSKGGNGRSDSSRRGRGRNGRGGDRPTYSAAAAHDGNATKPVVMLNREQDALSGAAQDELETPGLLPTPTGEIGADDAFYLPQIGVEVVATETRNGNRFHSIHDLRNGHVIHNVTRKGARKLWSYAIQQHEDNAVNHAKIQWQGDIGLVHIEQRAGKVRYDLALRDQDGHVRIFYGVTEDGMEGRWAAFVKDE
jgi:hypothetical protein